MSVEENSNKPIGLKVIARALQSLNFWSKNASSKRKKYSIVNLCSRTTLSKLQVIDKSGKGHYRWITLTAIAVLYNLIFILGRATFWQLQNAVPLLWIFLDGITDIIYFLDAVVHAHEVYLEDGMKVEEPAKLRRHYFKSTHFKLDIISLFPLNFELPFSSYPTVCSADDVPCPAILRSNRLLKIYRFNQFLNAMESRTRYQNLLQIAKVVLYIVLIIHWNSCFYFWLSNHIGFGWDEWVYPSVTMGGKHAQLLHQYTYCAYWSMLILTRITEVTLPDFRSDVEHIFVIMELFGGVLIFALIVGNVGSVISNMTQMKTEFQNEMDSIRSYLKFQKVSKELEGRVVKWFYYLMGRKQMFNEDKALDTLPDKLKMEIAMSLHLGTLKRIEMFQDCDPGLLTELVLKLKLKVFSPGDYVCRKGDIGKEMFIVKRGRVRVVGDDGITVYVTLESGSVFGEISLLNIVGSKTGNRRTANVRSVGYSDIFCLLKDDLWETLREYPEAQTALMKRGKEMLIKTGLLDTDESKLPRKLRQPEERVKALESIIKTLTIRIGRISNEYQRAEEKFQTRLENLENDIGYDIEDDIY